MNQIQKKVLDENLQFLQENLVLDETFYAGLIQNEIFTEDMVRTVKVSNFLILVMIFTILHPKMVCLPLPLIPLKFINYLSHLQIKVVPKVSC